MMSFVITGISNEHISLNIISAISPAIFIPLGGIEQILQKRRKPPKCFTKTKKPSVFRVKVVITWK